MIRDGLMKEKFKSVLPYIGLPFIITALLIVYVRRMDVYVIFQSGLIIVFGYTAAVFDIKAKHIPNGLILIMLAVWVVIAVPELFFNISAALPQLISSIAGFAVGGALFLAVYLISRKGLGGGDVKFIAAAGLYLGFSGTLTAILYGPVLCLIIGLVLLLLKKIGRRDKMPLAPFLYTGILITIFFR